MKNQSRYQGKNYIQQCLPNLTLRIQLIIIVGLLALLIMTILAIWNILQYNLLSSLFTNDSDFIYQKRSQLRNQQMQSLYEDYLYSMFYLNGNALISFHRLYQATRQQVIKQNNLVPDITYQMEYEGTTQIPDPLRILNQYNTNMSYSFMCYSNTTSYDSPLTQEEKIGIKLQEQVQAYGQIIYQDNLIMQSNIYSYIELQKINNLYPCVNRGQGIYTYNPPGRNWYQLLNQTYYNSTNYNEYQFHFTEPYLLFTYQTVGLSMTLPMVDENLNFIGGVASTFLGQQLVQNLSNNKTGFELVLLASENGILIMHPYTVNASDLPIYIYNESYTGFNQTDWEEIIKLSNGVSNCQLLNFKTGLTCRYNSKFQQEMMVSVDKLANYSMMMSINEYIVFSNTFHNYFKVELTTATLLNIVYMCSLVIMLMIYFLILTKILFSPIEQIVKTTLCTVQKNMKVILILPKITYIFMSFEMMNLIRSYQYLYKLLEMLSFHKTEQCSQIERIKYPTKQLSFIPFIYFYSLDHPFYLQEYYSRIRNSKQYDHIKIIVLSVIEKMQKNKTCLVQ